MIPRTYTTLVFTTLTLGRHFLSPCEGFVSPGPKLSYYDQIRSSKSPENILNSFSPRNNNNRNNNDTNNNAGSVATGAILGGLLGGPFGLLFGAQIGSSLGRKLENERLQKTEMDQLGITPEMLEMAQECGFALERAVEGLKATRESLDGLQKFARRLDDKDKELYEKARLEMSNGREEEARKLLLERQTVQEKLKKTLLNCKDEKVRFERMEINMEAIENRAIEVDSLLKRTVGAKALVDNNDDMGMINTFRMEDEDPLLRKFRDLERE